MLAPFFTSTDGRDHGWFVLATFRALPRSSAEALIIAAASMFIGHSKNQSKANKDLHNGNAPDRPAEERP